MSALDKIVCLGKNYSEHAKELGDAVPDKPVLFLKPASVLKIVSGWGQTLEATFPSDSGSVHHECEIVIRLKHGGYRLSPTAAAAAIGEVTLGLDMTLRDSQSVLKKAGHPWTVAKVFPDAAIVGPWKDADKFQNYLTQEFSLSIDGKVRQKGTGTQMICGPAESIAYASQFFPLCAGDLLFTGTPAGVGPVTDGQTAELKWGDAFYRVHWKAI